MESKTDPGPWTVERTTLEIVRGLITPEEVDAWEVRSSEGTICYIPDDGSERARANADLIARAPELLAG